MQTWGLLPAGAEDSSRGVVPEAERLVGEGPESAVFQVRNPGSSPHGIHTVLTSAP